MGSTFGSQKPEKIKVSSKTQEKAAKAGLKEFEKGEGLRKESRKTAEKIMSGRYAPETSIRKLFEDLEKATGGAKQFFEPIQQQATQDFERFTVPSLLNAMGSDAKSSSSLNQALSAAGKDLQLGLAAQFAPMELGLAQNLLNMKNQNKITGLQSRMGAASLGMGQGYQPLSLPSQTQSYALQPGYNPTGDYLSAAAKIGAAALI